MTAHVCTCNAPRKVPKPNTPAVCLGLECVQGTAELDLASDASAVVPSLVTILMVGDLK